MQMLQRTKKELWWIPLAICLTVLPSCKPVETIRYIHSTDSVFVKSTDSVFINQYTKGDTVFLEKEKYVTLYKDRFKTDTVRDTISVPKYITKEKKVSQKARKWPFWVGFCLPIIFYILCRILKSKNLLSRLLRIFIK